MAKFFWRERTGERDGSLGPLPRLEYLQPWHSRKVLLIESGHTAIPFHGGRRNDQIVGPDHSTRGVQSCPDARVFIRRLLGVRQDRHQTDDGPQVGLAL